jgi:hypothetical protein
MRRWWRGLQIWLAGSKISLALIPINGDLIGFTRRLRKGLRDVRDRSARRDYRWQSVAMAGLADGDRALILIRHSGMDRAEVWARFERRWPGIVLCNPGKFEPSSRMTVKDATSIAERRRGIEPIRIIIVPQIAATPPAGRDDLPMPMIVF